MGDDSLEKAKDIVTKSMLCFAVPGRPIGKARPRVVGGHAYTPVKTTIYERQVALYAKKAMVEQGFKRLEEKECCLLEINAYYAMPETWSKKKKAASLYGYKPTKPDLDNIIKIVSDALNAVAFHDDNAVVQIIATKNYAEKDYLHVRVIRLDQNDKGNDYE